MTSGVDRSYEIILDGTRFRTIGPVARNPASQWAAKVTLGDTDRDSDPHRSALGFSDLSGGIGLERITGAGDSTRTLWSTHDARYPGHLIHPPAAIGPGSAAFPNQRTIPIPTITDGPAPISFIQDFSNDVYVGFGTKVLKWNDTAGTWSDVLHTLPGTATDSIVTRLGDSRQLYLIIACGDSGYAYYDGTTWTNITDHEAEFLVWWDEKVWSMDSTGQLAYATTPADPDDDDDDTDHWTDDAWLPVPDDYVNALLTTKNTDGVRVIAAVTADGALWLHDATNVKFVQTDLDLPAHPETGVGATNWRGAVYIPSGMAVYRFSIQAIQSPVEVIGPDRDAGLPADRAGSIIQLLSTSQSLVAIVEGEIMPLTLAMNLSAGVFGLQPNVYYVARAKSTILERVGDGWQVLWAGGQDGQAMSDRPAPTNALVSAAYGEYRLWFSTSTQLWYIDLPLHVINPDQIPTREYVCLAETITPWFNASVAEAGKVALNLLAETRNLMGPGGPHIAFEIGYDYATDFIPVRDLYLDDLDPIFLPKQGDAGPGGLGHRGGVGFRAVRLRIYSEVGANPHTSPDLLSLTLEYYKRLGIRQKYEWRVNVDLSSPYSLLSARQLSDRLTELVDRDEQVSFVYAGLPEDPEDLGRHREPYYVKVLQDSRQTLSGDYPEQALASLTLVEL